MFKAKSAAKMSRAIMEVNLGFHSCLLYNIKGSSVEFRIIKIDRVDGLIK